MKNTYSKHYLWFRFHLQMFGNPYFSISDRVMRSLKIRSLGLSGCCLMFSFVCLVCFFSGNSIRAEWGFLWGIPRTRWQSFHHWCAISTSWCWNRLWRRVVKSQAALGSALVIPKPRAVLTCSPQLGASGCRRVGPLLSSQLTPGQSEPQPRPQRHSSILAQMQLFYWASPPAPRDESYSLIGHRWVVCLCLFWNAQR